VAAECDGGIRYLTSADGLAWSETSFATPVQRREMDPQLTLDGDTVFLAYSLLAPTDGACGDDGLQDLGVYTRFLARPGGTWSEPVRVGAKGDRVQSFRVANGVKNLTVTADDERGPLYYEAQTGGHLTRVQIPHAVSTSLRVGDDGHARIAYATGGAIRYARADGDHLAITTVASSTKTNLMWPSLVLGPGDHAYLVWTQSTDGGGGCAGPGPGPLDGVYFGTDVSGRWKTTRLTKTPAAATLTLDPATGDVHVVVDKGSALVHYQSTSGDVWSSTKIPAPATLDGPFIRFNPVTGGLNVFMTDFDHGIYLLTAR
jgi:hypothetical protein